MDSRWVLTSGCNGRNGPCTTLGCSGTPLVAPEIAPSHPSVLNRSRAATRATTRSIHTYLICAVPFFYLLYCVPRAHLRTPPALHHGSLLDFTSNFPRRALANYPTLPYLPATTTSSCPPNLWNRPKSNSTSRKVGLFPGATC